MTKLKRNMIELIKNPEEVMNGGEAEFERYWTSPFIPASVTYEALDLADKMDDEESEVTIRKTIDLLGNFVVDKLYNRQFTQEDLLNKFHGPDLITELRDQIYFIAQGEQTSDTKAFLTRKK